MDECIFCKIARGEIPSFKVYEDEDFLAFLDIFPNVKGMTVLITKKHHPSYLFEMDEETYAKMLSASKKVASMLDRALGVRRTSMVMEGMGINHAHIKLYPLHGLEKEFKAVESNEKIFFEKYQGYVTTKQGPKANFSELSDLSRKIRESLG
jgi:histidine triad (HIT) family protein